MNRYNLGRLFGKDSVGVHDFRRENREIAEITRMIVDIV